MDHNVLNAASGTSELMSVMIFNPLIETEVYEGVVEIPFARLAASRTSQDPSDF